MTSREQAAREAERRYPKRRFVTESYVQNAFIAGAEWASTIDKATEVAVYWGTCEGCGTSRVRCVSAATEVAVYWGTCEGCGTSRVRCVSAATEPGVVKCCPDCNHVTAGPHIVVTPCSLTVDCTRTQQVRSESEKQ